MIYSLRVLTYLLRHNSGWTSSTLLNTVQNTPPCCIVSILALTYQPVMLSSQYIMYFKAECFSSILFYFDILFVAFYWSHESLIANEVL